jgi:putative ABC transport system permease protein
VQTSQLHVAGQQTRAGLRADHVLTAPDGLAPGVSATIAGLPGVAAATGVAHGSMFTTQDGATSASAQGIDIAGSVRTLDLGVVHGSLAELRGDEIAVDTLTARALHLNVGGTFSGWFGDGAPARLRVVAIYGRGLGFAPLTVDRALLEQHTGGGLDDAVLIRLAPGAAPDGLRSRLAQLAPGSALVAAADYRVGLDRNLQEGAWSQRVVTVVLLVYVVIAAVNSLVTYALGRRREFAMLRLAGTTRRQVLRMVSLQQAFLLALALALGLAIAAITLIPMVKGTTGSTAVYIPPTGWASVLGGVALLGLGATALPVRRALRMRPVDAVGLRE